MPVTTFDPEQVPPADLVKLRNYALSRGTTVDSLRFHIRHRHIRGWKSGESVQSRVWISAAEADAYLGLSPLVNDSVAS
jgi:hypothetical protein